jgi:topoisomerase-4 subunit A
VDFLKAGTSTLSKLDLWYDADTGRLNRDKRGKYLGKFDGDDKIIAFMRNGSYKITSYELTNRYEPERVLHLEKFHPDRTIAAVYVDGESKQYMVKRFNIETSTADKEFVFISEGIGSRLIAVSTSDSPEIEVELIKGKDKGKKTETMNLEELVDVKGWKALGNRLSEFKVTKVTLVQDDEPEYEEPGEDGEEEVTESEKDSQSPKKKAESLYPRQIPEPQVGEDGQAILFSETEKPKHQLPPRPAPKPRVKAEQQNLFGQSPDQQKSSQESKSGSEKEVAGEKVVPVLGNVGSKTGKDEGGKDGKSFNVGETIEFDL